MVITTEIIEQLGCSISQYWKKYYFNLPPFQVNHLSFYSASMYRIMAIEEKNVLDENCLQVAHNLVGRCVREAKQCDKGLSVENKTEVSNFA